jgi:hypothetical protein
LWWCLRVFLHSTHSNTLQVTLRVYAPALRSRHLGFTMNVLASRYSILGYRV